MKELKLNGSPRLKVITDQGEFQLRKPKLGEARELEHSLNEKDADPVEIMGSFFEKLGMKKEAFNDLDTDQISMLQDALLPKKKR